MRCIKTGFYAYLASANRFIYGDAFVIPQPGDIADTAFNCGYSDDAKPGTEPLLLRIKSVSSERPDRVQLEINDYAYWFEEETGKNVAGPSEGYVMIYQPCSTLIAVAGRWEWLGYDGRELAA